MKSIEFVRRKNFELRVYESNDNEHSLRITICDKDGSPLDVCRIDDLVEALHNLL